MTDSKVFWNKQAHHYDSTEGEEISMLMNLTKDYIQSNDLVLDFACGTGVSTLAISKLAGKVTGIDISEEMIRYARAKRSDKLTFEVTTLEETTLANETFDLIVAFNILHLIDDLPVSMIKIKSLLKPGGLFVSYTACLGEKKNLSSLLIQLMGRFSAFPNTFSYTCLQLENEVCSYGFESIQSTIVDEKVANLYLVVKKK